MIAMTELRQTIIVTVMVLSVCVSAFAETDGVYSWENDGVVIFTDNPGSTPNGSARKRTVRKVDMTDQRDPPKGVDASSQNESFDEPGSIGWFRKHFLYQPPDGYELDAKLTNEKHAHSKSAFYSKPTTYPELMYGVIQFEFIDMRASYPNIVLKAKQNKLDFQAIIKLIRGYDWRGKDEIFSTLAGRQAYIINRKTHHKGNKLDYLYYQKLYTFIIDNSIITITIESINNNELDAIEGSLQSMRIKL